VRYDSGVRTVLVGLGFLAALATFGAREASSKPSRLNDMDILERDDPVEPCDRGKTWKVVEKCLGKQGTTKVLYESEGVKVVQVASVPSTSTRISLYTQREQTWFRGSLYVSTNPSFELLGVRPFTSPLGIGVRIDVGQTLRSMISFDQSTSTRGLVRRVTSTVCVPSTWQCRAVMTSCDAYVHGRLLWTFQGAVMWHASLGLRLQGDATRAGGLCMPPRTMLDNEDTGG
jgi:hypothetical protein